MPETCDLLDNDCTGEIDNGDPGGGGSCPTGLLGVCDTGTLTRQAGSLNCVPNLEPSAEICDSLDNDCDGTSDDGDPGGGAVCATGRLGVCAAGHRTCTAGALVCAQDLQPSTELCDSFDNDCDGMVNEGNPGGGAPCITQLPGVCAAGTRMCQNGSLACVQNVSAGPEICGDALDNDCDGQSNEGC